MFQKKKKPESSAIKKYVNDLYTWGATNPDQLFPFEVDAQFVVECLKEAFLGPDWYCALPCSQKQVNNIILNHILSAHSREFRRYISERNEQEKERRRANDQA